MKATVRNDSLQCPLEASATAKSACLMDQRAESRTLAKLAQQLAHSPKTRQLRAQQESLASGVVQRREVADIPGISSIDTADYTEDELDLLFHQAADAGQHSSAAQLDDAIDAGEHKADMPEPDAVNGITSRQPVYFLPVTLFQDDSRIPPRRTMPYPIAVLINRGQLGKASVTLSIHNNGGANGLVSIQGNDSVELEQSAAVTLRGLAQTAPGNARNLRFIASVGPHIVRMSSPFTVAAIPRNWNVVGKEPIKNAPMPGFQDTFWGMTVEEEWESDSGITADLDEVEVDEQVELSTATGVYAGQTIGVRGPTAATLTHYELDDHAIATGEITGPGTKKILQVHTYRDARTGFGWQPIAHSGYMIEQTIAVEKGRQTKYTITTSKYGAAATVNGFSSKAGSGNQSDTVTVMKNNQRKA